MMTDEEMMNRIKDVMTAVQVDMAKTDPASAAEMAAYVPMIVEMAEGDTAFTRSILKSVVANFGDL